MQIGLIIIKQLREMGCVHEGGNIKNPKSFKDSVALVTQKYKSKVLADSGKMKTFKDIVLPKILSNLEILNFKLESVFQASKYEFSAQEFHKATDGVQNTIFIAQADNGAIFGGFTPSKWQDNVMYKYAEDEKKISFLFRIFDKQEKQNPVEFFEIMEHQSGKAILNNVEDGPVFGSGRDINIVDKCDVRDCWANLGQTYSCGFKFGSNKANSALGGFNVFKIREYEIWRIAENYNEEQQ